MHIALCQFNPIVGAISQNASRLIEFAQKAHQQGAVLMVAPELALCGYPPKDILFHPELTAQINAGLSQIAANCPIPIILGAPISRGEKTGQPFWNAAVLCQDNKWQVVARKQLLPNYDVFDERRYFEPPTAEEVGIPIEIEGVKLGITICEETWNDPTFFAHRRYEQDPMHDAVKRAAHVLINIASSPFAQGKPALREKMLAHVATHHHVPLLMCGQVGANDQLIFDGSSVAIDKMGVTQARLEPFSEGLLIADVDKTGEIRTSQKPDPELPRFEWMRLAIVCGISDYFKKCGVKGALVGLSGGIDSAVCATLAVQALGAKNVVGVRMPSAFSSQHSLEDAGELAQNLGIKTRTFEIESHVETLRKTLGGHLKDITDQNLQSRVRGLLLMALSNETGKLVLATGNKSEFSVGYCTLYGDMCGAVAPLGDVYKTDIWPLARHLNLGGELIPTRSIEKVPSAELRQDQSDQDTLPPYEDLDAILKQYVEKQASVDIIEKSTGLKKALILKVASMVHQAEFKRSQSPQILALSDQVFGQGRRWPIAHQFGP